MKFSITGSQRKWMIIFLQLLVRYGAWRGHDNAGRCQRWHLANLQKQRCQLYSRFSPERTNHGKRRRRLRYKIVRAQLPVDSLPDVQGVSILVIESDATPDEYVAQAYKAAGRD